MLPIFQSRTKSPLLTDEFWIHHTKGGKNYCILIKEDSVLPNCVGYAWGRWLEILHEYHRLSKGNAENWWLFPDGYERGRVPKYGAVACWRKGEAGVSSDGAGHVAIVEDILSDGTIVTSNSGYLGSRFYMRTIKPPYSLGGEYFFQGFIYLPIEYKPNASPSIKPIITIAKEVIMGEWGNGMDRKAKLKAAGYNPLLVQNAVNELIKYKVVVPPKSIDAIANEVISGKWGVGEERKDNLTKAGYDYAAIQSRVNQLSNSMYAPNKPVSTIAKEVISGKWGVGLLRKQKLVNAGYNYEDVQKEVNRLLKD